MKVTEELSRSAAREQLRQDILERIRSGQLQPGEALVSEKRFAEMYDITLWGVQQVLSRLAEEDWLVRKPRAGTFVADTDQLRSAERQVSSGRRIVLLQPEIEIEAISAKKPLPTGCRPHME